MRRWLGLCIALAPGLTRAQDLAGPSAAEPPARPTLVEHGYDGRVQRLESTPEEAAVALVDLDEGARERIADIFVERAEFFDRVVSEEIDRLTRLGTAGETGDGLTVAAEGFALLQRLDPLFSKGRLEDRIAAEMPAEEAARFRALVREYWGAIVDEKRARPSPKRRARWELLVEAKAEGVGGEVERSFQRLATGPGGAAQLLFGYLKIRPEQEARVMPLWIRYMELSDRGEGESKEAKMLFVGMLAHLDEAQRNRILGIVKPRKP